MRWVTDYSLSKTLLKKFSKGVLLKPNFWQEIVCFQLPIIVAAKHTYT